MVATRTLMTAEEFFALPDDGVRRELVCGEVVERDMAPPGEQHGDVQLELGLRMRLHARREKLGRVTAETGFRLATDPDTVRLPDVAFVSAARLPPGPPRAGLVPGAPDIAVEVVSPSDTLTQMQRKVQSYLDAGARLVWVVDPATQTVTAYRPDGSARVLRQDDLLSGEDVMPGFAVRVGELFAG